MSPQDTTWERREVNQRPEISSLHYTCLVPFLLTGLIGSISALLHLDGVCGPHGVELAISVPAPQTAGQGDEAEEQQRCNEGPHPD